MQQLDPVAGLVHENIDITVARVGSHRVGHYPCQGMKTFAHVAGAVVQKIPKAVVQVKHGHLMPG